MENIWTITKTLEQSKVPVAVYSAYNNAVSLWVATFFEHVIIGAAANGELGAKQGVGRIRHYHRGRDNTQIHLATVNHYNIKPCK